MLTTASANAERGAAAVRTYEPGSGSGWGVGAWRLMFRELFAGRELIWRLLVRDFLARYRQSVLGVGWALLLPAVAVSTFLFLSSAGLLNVGEVDVPYPVFALLGLSVWQVFASGLAACSNAVVAAGSMVVKVNFPKAALVIAAMGQVLFELVVRLALLAVAMLVFQVTPSWTALLLPLTLLPLVLLTLGIGLFLSLLNVLVRDVANVVTLLTTFLLLLTPVMYAAPPTGLVASLTRLNPVAWLVIASRDVVLLGRLTDPWGFAAGSLLGVALCLISLRVFHVAGPRMAERA